MSQNKQEQLSKIPKKKTSRRNCGFIRSDYRAYDQQYLKHNVPHLNTAPVDSEKKDLQLAIELSSSEVSQVRKKTEQPISHLDSEEEALQLAMALSLSEMNAKIEKESRDEVLMVEAITASILEEKTPQKTSTLPNTITSSRQVSNDGILLNFDEITTSALEPQLAQTTASFESNNHDPFQNKPYILSTSNLNSLDSVHSGFYYGHRETSELPPPPSYKNWHRPAATTMSMPMLIASPPSPPPIWAQQELIITKRKELQASSTSKTSDISQKNRRNGEKQGDFYFNSQRKSRSWAEVRSERRKTIFFPDLPEIV